MFNKNLLKVSILIIFLSIIFLSVSVTAAEYTLTLGHNASDGSYTHAGTLEMKEVIEDLTDGNVVIEIYPSNQLGGNREMLQGTGMGSQDISISGLGVLSYLEPRYAFLQMPYLFSSQDHLHRYVQESDIALDMFDSLVEEHNIYLLSQTWDRMPRQIAADRPIYGPDYVENLFIRGGVEAVTEFYDLLGAQSTHVDLGEMYVSMQQGIIEAVELPIDYFYEYSIYEVADYLSMVEHIYGTQFVAINNETFQELPKEYQEAVIEGVKAGEKVNNEIVWEEDEKYMNLLREEGMQVVERDEVDYGAFVDALEENINALYEIWPEAEGMFEDIQSFE